jgi:hypothetical protein
MDAARNDCLEEVRDIFEGLRGWQEKNSLLKSEWLNFSMDLILELMSFE